MKQAIQYPFPVFITQEGKWFVAECPLLDIASQGETELEAKENIQNLIQEYLQDPDTPKIQLRKLSQASLTYIPAFIPKALLAP